MVSGWFGDDLEVEFVRPEDGAFIFEVRFRDGSNSPQSFRMDIAEFHARTWSAVDEDEIDFDHPPNQLAGALLENGAAEMPFEHYLIGNRAPSTLDGTLRDIAGIGGVARYGVV